MIIEGLQEPYYHRGDEYDRESLGDEVLRLVVYELPYALGAGQAVVGQLHDEGHGLSLKGSPLEQQRKQYAHYDAYEI